jgi:hypothetical protein
VAIAHRRARVAGLNERAVHAVEVLGGQVREPAGAERGDEVAVRRRPPPSAARPTRSPGSRR